MGLSGIGAKLGLIIVERAVLATAHKDLEVVEVYLVGEILKSMAQS